MPSSKRLAQTVGLWLAEGDKKARREITFTNNQPYLISLFHRVVTEQVGPDHSPRIYVYVPSLDFKYEQPVPEARYRLYVDSRATRPYYIYRVSGVSSTKRWRELVTKVCADRTNFGPILQGFFAGEGNVKEGIHKSRQVRIAQGEPLPFLETMLSHYGISFRYGDHRQYNISGRANLEKLLALGITHLHRDKHAKFLKMMAGYRQFHYPKNHLTALVLSELRTPRTSLQLARKSKRSVSRIHQVLSDLTSKGTVLPYHVNSTFYWVRRDANTIVISGQKSRILRQLEKLHHVSEIARALGRTDKSVCRRLLELERMGLTKREKANWRRVGKDCRVIER